jgi:hypothetical protein
MLHVGAKVQVDVTHGEILGISEDVFKSSPKMLDLIIIAVNT